MPDTTETAIADDSCSRCGARPEHLHLVEGELGQLCRECMASRFGGTTGEALADHQPVRVTLESEGVVSVRHTEEPHSQVLFLTPAQWVAFAEAVREGVFDLAALARAGDGSGVDGAARVQSVPLADFGAASVSQ